MGQNQSLLIGPFKPGTPTSCSARRTLTNNSDTAVSLVRNETTILAVTEYVILIYDLIENNGMLTSLLILHRKWKTTAAAAAGRGTRCQLLQHDLYMRFDEKVNSFYY